MGVTDWAYVIFRMGLYFSIHSIISSIFDLSEMEWIQLDIWILFLNSNDVGLLNYFFELGWIFWDLSFIWV